VENAVACLDEVTSAAKSRMRREVALNRGTGDWRRWRGTDVGGNPRLTGEDDANAERARYSP
jgi:hypothetical protein